VVTGCTFFCERQPAHEPPAAPAPPRPGGRAAPCPGPRRATPHRTRATRAAGIGSACGLLYRTKPTAGICQGRSREAACGE
jgi:hypothetical protein